MSPSLLHSGDASPDQSRVAPNPPKLIQAHFKRKTLVLALRIPLGRDPAV